MYNFTHPFKTIYLKIVESCQSLYSGARGDHPLNAITLATAAINVTDRPSATSTYRQLLKYRPYDQSIDHNKSPSIVDACRQLDRSMHSIGRAILLPGEAKEWLCYARDGCMKVLCQLNHHSNPNRLNHYLLTASQFLFIMRQMIVREKNAFYRQEYIDYTIRQIGWFMVHASAMQQHLPIAERPTAVIDAWALLRVNLHLGE